MSKTRRHCVTLELKEKADIPFFAFALTAADDNQEITAIVLRSPDDTSHIAVSRIPKGILERLRAPGRLSISVQATEDDCGFLLRLPIGTKVELAWTEMVHDFRRSKCDGDERREFGSRPTFTLLDKKYC